MRSIDNANTITEYASPLLADPTVQSMSFGTDFPFQRDHDMPSIYADLLSPHTWY